MDHTLLLPPGIALAIIAFLLSLLPAALFIWIWYLRHHNRPISPQAVAIAFFIGIILVLPAFYLEDLAANFWRILSPETAHYFDGAVLPLLNFKDILLPAIGTFVVVATVEEGLRYLILRIWIARSRIIDQVFDGLVIGVAMGLGFATLENTLYFLAQLKVGDFDTLVFIFFLRFMISTLAHVSFGGLMGALIARGVFDMYRPYRYFIPAMLIPWFVHGLYDLLLGINQSLYAVLLPLPVLAVLTVWAGRGDFLTIFRRNGKLLASPEKMQTNDDKLKKRLSTRFKSPWNKNAGWLDDVKTQRELFKQKKEE